MDVHPVTAVAPVPHPAKFTPAVLECIKDLLRMVSPGWARIIDPFYGTGRLGVALADDQRFFVCGTEIEHEWAVQGPNAVRGNALQLPFADGTFDGAVTSCTYANRMADSHDAKDGSKRLTYRHQLGRKLHEDNSGQMQWGERYKLFHRQAWAELHRVIRPGGFFILNVADHIRGGERIGVSAWHREAVETTRFSWEMTEWVDTPKMGFGANAKARVPGEDVHLFLKESA